MNRQRHAFAGALQAALISVACFLATGCATYRPSPLSSEGVEARLKPPSMAEVRVRAASLKHPLLHDIPFNTDDGLSPEEAAVLAVIANPELKALRDRRGVAKAQVLQAGLLPNPDLSFSLDAPVGGERQGKVTAFGLGLDWEVSRLIGRNARQEAASDDASALDLEIAWQEWQVA